MQFYLHTFSASQRTRPWPKANPALWNYEQNDMRTRFPNTASLVFENGMPVWTVKKRIRTREGLEFCWSLAVVYATEPGSRNPYSQTAPVPIPKVILLAPSPQELGRIYPGLIIPSELVPDIAPPVLTLPDEARILRSIRRERFYGAADALLLAAEYLTQLVSNHSKTTPAEAPAPTSTGSTNLFQRIFRNTPPSTGIRVMPTGRMSPDCQMVVLSDRAYRAILSETSSFGDRETGGLMLGNFHNGFWYVLEGVDPGFSTVNQTTVFEYQVEYVNHLSKKLGLLYKHPLTILGIWHRHPESMDFFSDTDYASMAAMTRDASVGLVFMLVNIDPAFRMTFYYLSKDLELYRVPVVVGDEYIPEEIRQLAAPESLCYHLDPGNPVPIRPMVRPDPSKLPRTVDELNRFIPITGDLTPENAPPAPEGGDPAPDPASPPLPTLRQPNSGG